MDLEADCCCDTFCAFWYSGLIYVRLGRLVSFFINRRDSSSIAISRDGKVRGCVVSGSFIRLLLLASLLCDRKCSTNLNSHHTRQRSVRVQRMV